MCRALLVADGDVEVAVGLARHCVDRARQREHLEGPLERIGLVVLLGHVVDAHDDFLDRAESLDHGERNMLFLGDLHQRGDNLVVRVEPHEDVLAVDILVFHFASLLYWMDSLFPGEILPGVT